MDPLGDLLDGVRARTAAFCRAVLEPPWGLRIVDRAPLALATPLRGHAWVVPDRGDPTLLHTGDVAICQGPEPYTVADHRDTSPSNVSGAAYTGVIPPVTLAITPWRSFTWPKSATLTWLQTRNRFWGLMSRCWRLCFSIRWSRPSAVC